MKPTKDDQATSFRLDAESRELIARLRARLGLNQSAVMRLALRRLSEAEGVRGNFTVGGGR